MIVENHMNVPPKIENRTAMRFSGFIPGYVSKRNQYVQKTSALPCSLQPYSQLAKKWQQPKCPSADEWLKNMYIHSMKYHSVIKRNEILPFAARWMELKIIISEISQP